MDQLIDSIYCVLNHQNEKKEIDEQTYKMAKKHALTAFLYLVMDEKKTAEPIVKKIKQEYYQTLSKDMMQEHELQELIDLLNKAKIKHIPLKGSVLKKIYPESYLRTMGDIDLLVERKDFHKVSQILEKMGYEKKKNAEHHLEFLKRPMMVIELHRSLITKKELGSELFVDPFAMAQKGKDQSYTYELNLEDFYLYMMCHLLKHHINGGTGLRSYLDIYLYFNQYPNLNFDSINQKLAKTNYLQEATLFKDFACHLFQKEPLNQQEKDLYDYICSSGTYGNLKHITESDLNANQGSANKVILKKLFLPVSSMKEIYLYVNKCILLLPFAYIQRFFNLVFSKHARRRAKELKKEEKNRKSESYHN